MSELEELRQHIAARAHDDADYARCQKLMAERDAKRAEVDELLYLRAEDEALIRNLEAERDAAYARGLERAAEIVKSYTNPNNGLKSAAVFMTASSIAAAIRSELRRDKLPDGEAKPAAEAE